VGSGSIGLPEEGFSVALSGDGNTALLGGWEDNSGVGAVWIFTRSSNGNWTQQGNKLVGTGGTYGWQGTSAALSTDGNTALVGGASDNSGVGAVWVFTRDSDGTWSQQGSKLIGSGAIGAATQGRSVALSSDGNTALIGAPFDNNYTGAAWVFTRDANGVWTQQGSKLVGSGAAGTARQGFSVALAADGSTAAVGGWADKSAAGAVWIFTRDGDGNWSQAGNKLVGTGALGAASQGVSVALSGDGNTALLGGSYDNQMAGAAWVFTRDSKGNWSQAGNKLVGSSAVGASQQAYAVALSTDGKTGLLGGWADNSDAGAVWPFVRALSGPLEFVPVRPCRVADTRRPDGPFGGPELAGNTSRTFPISNSACSIPSIAAAYSLNVTVVPDAGLGYLSIWPTGQSRPLVSTLNSDGRIKADAAIVPAGSAGGVNVYVTNPTHLVLDIDGYFVPAGTSTLAFYPLTPCRVTDTRKRTGPLGGSYIQGGTARDFPVLSSSCSIPSSAQAYSLNLTAVPHSGLAYITVWPTGETQPLVSTLNALTGAITANAAIVPAGSAGEISIYATNDTDLVIDVNGYFAPPDSGGLSLYTRAPCRVLDTRLASGEFVGTLTANVTGSTCGTLPSAARAFVQNATVVPGGSLAYLTLWPNGEMQPLVSTLNALDGVITSNMALVPTTNGSIDVFATNPTQLILDISGFFAP
jgi:flagellar basal body rod protein FlgF